MTGEAQQLTAKLLALKEPKELDVLKLVQSAFDELLAPHDEKHAGHIALVNETQEKASKEVAEIRTILSQVQAELDTAKDYIDVLKNENETEVQRTKEAKSGLFDAHQQLAGMIQAVKDFAQQLTEKDKAFVESQAMIVQLKDKVTALDELIIQKDLRLTEAQAQLTALSEKLTKLAES